ncbi:MAG: hypothetical protein ACI8YQ_004960 [Polaribacter sp.]|jgi:hypothetical protein
MRNPLTKRKERGCYIIEKRNGGGSGGGGVDNPFVKKRKSKDFIKPQSNR